MFNKDIKQPLIYPDILPLHRQLRLKRQFEGLTLNELGKRLGFSGAMLSYYETGAKRISRNHIDRVKTYVYDEVYVEYEPERKENKR